jgi:uncharacterized protein GlcG (DUF336 family)
MKNRRKPADTTATRTLTLDGARKVMDAAIAQADKMEQPFCIAVTDAAGEAILTARMDGAPRLSAGIALNKAFTVTGFGGMPTDQFWDAIRDDPALMNGITHTPRLVVFGGGVGVFVDGTLVGAVGVSGGTTDQDAEVANAAAAAID